MKVFLPNLVFVFISIIFEVTPSFAQEKKYVNFTIGKFTLEKFPVIYYKKPYKVMTQKFPLTEKIVLYQDMDQYGQNDGLRVEMQDDFVSPHVIYYYKKGIVVYTAYFFQNSSKAYEITNKNLQDQEDGPQIKRHLENGKLIQENKIFHNGEDLANKGTNGSDKLNFNSKGLLDGPFVWTANLEHLNGKLQYSGIAKDGIIQKLAVNSTLGESYMQFKSNYEVKNDLITQNTIESSGGVSNSTYKITTALKITNSKDSVEKGINFIYYEDILAYPYGSFKANYFERLLFKMTE